MDHDLVKFKFKFSKNAFDYFHLLPKPPSASTVPPPTSNDNNMQWDAENERRMKALSDNPKQNTAVGRDAKITLLGSAFFSSQTLIMLDKAFENQMKGTKITNSDAKERSLHLTALRSQKLSELCDAIAKSKQDNVDGHKLHLLIRAPQE